MNITTGSGNDTVIQLDWSTAAIPCGLLTESVLVRATTLLMQDWVVAVTVMLTLLMEVRVLTA